MTMLKHPDLILPEVRKAGGYGTLVAVLDRGNNQRELWFRGDHMTRVVVVDLPQLSAGDVVSVRTKGKRKR